VSNERKLPDTAKAGSRHDPIAAAPGYATRDFARLEAHIAIFHILEAYLLSYRFCSLCIYVASTLLVSFRFLFALRRSYYIQGSEIICICLLLTREILLHESKRARDNS
jgi:hypothetical protein